MLETQFNRLYEENGQLFWKHNNKRVGCLDYEGYRVFGYNKRQYKEHRVVFFLHKGYWPNQLDHINQIKNDNRIENLRDTNHSQNQYNRSNVKGITKRSSRGTWEARISVGGKRLHLGNFKCETAAKLAYQAARQRYYGEYA